MNQALYAFIFAAKKTKTSLLAWCVYGFQYVYSQPQVDN